MLVKTCKQLASTIFKVGSPEDVPNVPSLREPGVTTFDPFIFILVIMYLEVQHLLESKPLQLFGPW
jgi:hypothetical protein